MALMLGVVRSLNAPRQALAMGVRTVDTMTASCMKRLSLGNYTGSRLS